MARSVNRTLMVALIALVAVMSAGVVFAQFPDQWTKDPLNPIHTGFVGSTVLYHESVYKAWGLGGPDGFRYAESLDGRTWNVGTSPVLVPGPGDYDDETVDNASVVIVDDIYHMFYSCESSDGHSRIAHATSTNGTMWQKDPANPVMNLGCAGDFDSSELIHPTVIYEAPVFRMWYNGVGGGDQIIMYAVSVDGTLWARDPNPALELGPPGDWDDEQLYMMDVFQHNGTYYMFYTGSQIGGDFGIGYVTSQDGRTWVRPTSPAALIAPGGTGTWESLAVLSPVIMPTASGFTMYYAGTTDFTSFSWGIATAPFPTAAPPVRESRLDQNAPNPFNPRTTIHYALPNAARVDLKIYDAAGRHVRDLIRGKLMSIGDHEVPWDGRDDAGLSVVSGVYHYRLDAGSFSETKKMVLVR